MASFIESTVKRSGFYDSGSDNRPEKALVMRAAFPMNYGYIAATFLRLETVICVLGIGAVKHIARIGPLRC